jgi:hypothetical protein
MGCRLWTEKAQFSIAPIASDVNCRAAEIDENQELPHISREEKPDTGFTRFSG